MQFKPGTSNRVANALSRKGGAEVELGALLSVPQVDWSVLDTEVAQDSVLQQIRRDLLSGSKVRGLASGWGNYYTKVEWPFFVSHLSFRHSYICITVQRWVVPQVRLRRI